MLHAGNFLSVPSRRRCPLLVVLLLPLVVIYYQLFQRYDTRPGSGRSRLEYPSSHLGTVDAIESSITDTNVTVNLVIASRRRDDIAWTRYLSDAFPNLKIIRYISDFLPDEPLPEYHPPLPKKGREATIFHTYMHDFYPRLPDISIFIHAEEQPWHIDGVLQQSMLFALRHLDLNRIAARGGYANLRVSWADSCPAGIDTTKSLEEATKIEEPYMRPAFEGSFPGQEVPEVFAGPCCSQFAVTREAIHRNHRTQYARSRGWLMTSEFRNHIRGRTWEHMWPWLFLRDAPDAFREQAAKNCPVEWNAYCSMYGICFGDLEKGADDYDAPSRYNKKWSEKESLRRDHLEEWWNRLLHPFRAAGAAKRIASLEAELDVELREALGRGNDQNLRDRAFTSLFTDTRQMH